MSEIHKEDDIQQLAIPTENIVWKGLDAPENVKFWIKTGEDKEITKGRSISIVRLDLDTCDELGFPDPFDLQFCPQVLVDLRFILQFV